MKNIILLFAVLCSFPSFSKEFEAGNIIPEYGKTFLVEDPEFKTETNPDPASE